MNWENALKYHFAKSTMISDSPSYGFRPLTGTDIMAAQGMVRIARWACGVYGKMASAAMT
ncbi:hypothetical protein [Cronobacter sakazakii]|uniref:hypothetical protein n=1 Tax=Cronobacter sakazakii TaxID=28141 RepID=UPI001F5B762F|nr:hypothetical protein [Cronobacter sakazakii]